MIRLLKVRHEKSAFNRDNIITGNLDPPLTKEGAEGAKMAHDYFHDYNIEEILTGNKIRQIESAQVAMNRIFKMDQSLTKV